MLDADGKDAAWCCGALSNRGRAISTSLEKCFKHVNAVARSESHSIVCCLFNRKRNGAFVIYPKRESESRGASRRDQGCCKTHVPRDARSGRGNGEISHLSESAGVSRRQTTKGKLADLLTLMRLKRKHSLTCLETFRSFDVSSTPSLTT